MLSGLNLANLVMVIYSGLSIFTRANEASLDITASHISRLLIDRVRIGQAQVLTLEEAGSGYQQQAEASQQALEEAQVAHQAALEEKAAEAAELVEAQNAFYQQYEELTASYQELQGHYETANAQLQVRVADWRPCVSFLQSVPVI